MSPVEGQRLLGACLFADDVIGGFFALNGGAFEAALGHVQYFAPDTLNWQDTKMNYSQFLVWACSDSLNQFYQGYRWENWQADVRVLSGDKGFSIYPFLWAEGPPIGNRSRKAIRIEELWDIEMEMRDQMMKVSA